MAYITHTSTGASNSPKLVSVTSRIITMPHPSDRWFDFQVDSGLVESGGLIQSWTDSVNSNVITSSNLPIADAANKLLAVNTPKFSEVETLARVLSKGATITGYPVPTSTTTTYALVYRRGGGTLRYGTNRRPFCLNYLSGGTYYFLSGLEEHPTTYALKAIIPKSGGGVAYADLSKTSPAGWNLLIMIYDYGSDTLTAYHNGTSLGTFSLPDNPSVSAPNNLHLGHTLSGGAMSNAFMGNIGALVSWKVALDSGDCASLKEYFETKYNITFGA